MRHASTIAMARSLLAQGRPDDVVRMIDPLAGDDVHTASDIVVHALMARVHLLVHADPARAKIHLEKAFEQEDASPEAESERRLWRGWLHAWPHENSFQPATALADFQLAHRIATEAHIPSTAAWALLGGAFLYGWLREAALCRHLLNEAEAFNTGRHDVDFRAWHGGCSAALALSLDDSTAARAFLDVTRPAVQTLNVSLYSGRLRALETRLAVLEGNSAEFIERLSAEARALVSDGARTYSPAVAELELCGIDAAVREGDLLKAKQLLDAIPDAANRLVLFPDRIDKRRKVVFGDPVTSVPGQRLPSETRPLRWPDGGTFRLAFWDTVPDLRSTRLPLLLVGDRGTGKKYFAEQIERPGSGPFIHFDCTAPVSGDIDVVLFGSDGGGLFKEADGGTLFLREIHRLPLDTQRRLARLLRSRDYNMRFVASTTKPLQDLIDLPGLSHELLNEIGRLVIELPPLRNRRSHIPLLVSDLIEKLRPTDLTLASITQPALEALVKYDWPGNIRQLQNELERLLTIVGSEPAPVIHLHDLSEAIVGSLDLKTFDDDGVRPVSLEDVVAEAERSHIETILARNNGQVSATAAELGLTRQGLYKKMKRLGVDSTRFSTEAAASISS